jgi:uncharacterized protein
MAGPTCIFNIFTSMYRPLVANSETTHLAHWILDEELWLLPEKAIYWPERKVLLIADLHLGKTTHFRRSGVNVPMQVLYDDIAVLDNILSRYAVERVIVLGDLFHADENSEWDIFGAWLLSRSIPWELIRGNHDVLPFGVYERYGVRVYDNYLEEPPFILTHYPLEDPAAVPPGRYVLCGHVHPAVVLTGKAYQSLRVSCFYFGPEQGILPAFGRFTGCEVLEIRKRDKVFVIAGDRVIQLGK